MTSKLNEIHEQRLDVEDTFRRDRLKYDGMKGALVGLSHALAAFEGALATEVFREMSMPFKVAIEKIKKVLRKNMSDHGLIEELQKEVAALRVLRVNFEKKVKVWLVYSS